MLHLYLIPLILVLIGLAFYTVLGGADFGAGFWQLTAGKGRQAQAVREHAHAAMAPVWEANHVWLIFVLTVVWTAYPTAFGSIASTLSIPLFIAAVGIIFRGIAYALRAGAAGRRELSAIDTVFSISSVLTPFALGTAVGGIASGRVPVGNADRIFHRLTTGAGLAGLVISLVAGVATLALVWRRQYEPARYSAAAAVAAIIAGWALSQSPLFLPGLTIEAAAAPRTTLIAVTVAVLAGALILFPSLALLFRLVLSGRLAEGDESVDLRPTPRLVRASRHGFLARAAVACLIAGIGLLTVAEAAWAHALGVVSLLGFVALGFPAALPRDVVPHNETKR